MMRGLLSLYSWRYPAVLVYMLQSTEYQAGPYLRWFWHTNNFATVMYRRTLDSTRAARLLVLALRLGMILQIIAGLACIALWQWRDMAGGLYFGLAILLSYPIAWAHLAMVPLELGRIVIVRPRQRKAIRQSEALFRDHPGVKIAIAGSYGKTSMKELLVTVLGGAKTVAATPANKNVAISHAYFAQKLTGTEDILIIEYGESGPGDVARFAKITHPTHAIITGIAPAHLDHYKTVDEAARDIFSVADYVDNNRVYVNKDSRLAAKRLTKANHGYDAKGALGWKVSKVAVGLDGIRFTMTKGKRSMRLHSRLLGRHQIGPLVLAAALADVFGLTEKQITKAIARTHPFEHRMQPYQLEGAWVIDDTYNGNIEGIRAGTRLLGELTDRRKIYVTPGLVDQGAEANAIHVEMGELIAGAHPDIVVLMQNSATDSIATGLKKAGYTGELIIENDPLNFYTNLAAFVAHGDIVLMQNDWTDNYV